MAFFDVNSQSWEPSEIIESRKLMAGVGDVQSRQPRPMTPAQARGPPLAARPRFHPVDREKVQLLSFIYMINNGICVGILLVIVLSSSFGNNLGMVKISEFKRYPENSG